LFWSFVAEDDAGEQPVLHIESLGHALHAFINGKLAGNFFLKKLIYPYLLEMKYFMNLCNKISICYDRELFSGSKAGNSENAKVNVDIPITIVVGKNTIDLLSLTVGLKVPIFLIIKYGIYNDNILVLLCIILSFLITIHQLRWNFMHHRTMELFMTWWVRGSLVQ
jgi:hypothetical protein